MSSWLVCCVHIRVILLKHTIGYGHLMWTVAAKKLIWSQVLLLLKSVFPWMPTEAETAATETPQCRVLWEFSVRPGMLCTVLEILWFDSNSHCTSQLLMIKSCNMINVLSLYGAMFKPRPESEADLLTPAICLVYIQLQIKIDLKAPRRACLLAPVLTKLTLILTKH